MKRVLFQGDSITDAGRTRDNDAETGRGYPTLIAAKLGVDEPGRYEFLNRGISGNRSVDLLTRVKRDMINLKPDIMSILIGINDVWHELNSDGVDAQRYEIYYDMIVSELKEALPNLKIMIIEPFVLRVSATEEHWDYVRMETEKRADAAKRTAQKYNLVFIPLMKKFDEAAKIVQPSYWLADGVHPTAAGHELIAREWIQAFREIL